MTGSFGVTEPPRRAEPVELRSADGTVLEGELATAEPPGVVPVAGAVLCHPHPQYGGTMRSLVIGALFAALPAAGVTCLRFNFRGVEGSGGTFDSGRGEVDDARAALGRARRRGTDRDTVAARRMVLRGRHRVVGARPGRRRVARDRAPLRFASDLDAVAADERPKLLLLAEHDEVRAPAEIETIAGSWKATEIEVVAGASHFFMGRTDLLTELAVDYAGDGCPHATEHAAPACSRTSRDRLAPSALRSCRGAPGRRSRSRC